MGDGSVEVFCDFAFAAAHRLTGVSADHPCARLHGHTFTVRVTLRGPMDERTGFVVDFADVHHAWARLAERLDHRYLNDVPGLENPTSEHLSRWIWRELVGALPLLSAVEVREASSAGVVYRG